MKKILLTLVLLLLPMFAQGQAASHTAFRVRFGTALPATCSPNTGDIFWKTSAPIGIYSCLVANTWTAGAGSAVGSLSVVDANTMQFVNGTNSQNLYVYRTFTDGSNYSRLSFVGNDAGGSPAILQECAGTGPCNVNLDIMTGSGTSGGVFVGISAGRKWGWTGNNYGPVASKGQHFTFQAANNDIAGTCTFAATTCTVTFTTAYTSAPVCQATDQTAAAPVRSAPTTTTVVLTGGTGAGATDVVAYRCDGNPS